MAPKIPISNIILKLLSQKNAYTEDDLLNCIKSNFDVSFNTDKPYYGINRTFKNMVNSGYIEVFDTRNTIFIRITDLGKQKYASHVLDSKTTVSNLKWDGKWRFIIVDLPESRKSERESIRYLLRKAKFYCLKNSVWVSPFPYEYILLEIKKLYGLHDEITIIKTSEIDQETENRLKNIFNII